MVKVGDIEVVPGFIIAETDFHTVLVLAGKGSTRPIPEWN